MVKIDPWSDCGIAKARKQTEQKIPWPVSREDERSRELVNRSGNREKIK